MLAYRQPQRALVAGLTPRRIGIADIAQLTLADTDDTGALTVCRGEVDVTDDIRLAVRAQRHLRLHMQAGLGEPLIDLAVKTMAMFVNDAAHDLGINTAGRRCERVALTGRWLRALGISIRSSLKGRGRVKWVRLLGFGVVRRFVAAPG